MNDVSTKSIVKVLNNIVDKKINTQKPLTIKRTLVYKAGSLLVATNLGRLTY